MSLPREDDATQVLCLLYQPGKKAALLGIHLGRGLDNEQAIPMQSGGGGDG